VDDPALRLNTWHVPDAKVGIGGLRLGMGRNPRPLLAHIEHGVVHVFVQMLDCRLQLQVAISVHLVPGVVS
jgi:hypothetical protein